MSREKRKAGAPKFAFKAARDSSDEEVEGLPFRVKFAALQQFPFASRSAANHVASSILPKNTVHHPHLLAQHFTKLYETGTASDCKLVSRDSKEFPAHRAILTAWSPVFTAMFTTNMTEKASGVCKMDNFDGRVIEAMLKFIYTCWLSGIGEFVEELLDLAEQYDIPDLNKACQELMEKDVTVKTAPWYFHLADRRGLGVKGKLADFIAQHKDEF